MFIESPLLPHMILCILILILLLVFLYFCFFFFNDTATTEIYTLSLHDALPIFLEFVIPGNLYSTRHNILDQDHATSQLRSEEHTSELQSLTNLVCRLLLEKKKQNANLHH